MNATISIQLLKVFFLLIGVLRASAQDSGYLPDLPGFPSGTYAQVAAVGAKLHGDLVVIESDPVTGQVKRRLQMFYFPPTEVYWTRMGVSYEYTDPAVVARYSNPSFKDGRDVVSQRTTVKYYGRDGGVLGYTMVSFAAGAVDRRVEFEPYAVDVGMPSPGSVGRPLEILTSGDMAEIQFTPKVTVFSVNNEESRKPDDTMDGMLQRLRKAAGEYRLLIPADIVRGTAAADAFYDDIRGVYQLGVIVCSPMKAKALVQNISSAIANWDQIMVAIEQQMQDSAYAYWESRIGRNDPWDAYRMEGIAAYHVASFFVPGWKIAGSGKWFARLRGRFKSVAEFASRLGRSSDFWFDKKIFDQLKDRGWNEGLIDDVISRPIHTSPAWNKAKNSPATAFYDKDGAHVVRDNITSEIIQISKRGDPGWIPDSTITNPYRP